MPRRAESCSELRLVFGVVIMFARRVGVGTFSRIAPAEIIHVPQLLRRA